MAVCEGIDQGVSYIIYVQILSVIHVLWVRPVCVINEAVEGHIGGTHVLRHLDAMLP